MNKFNHVCVAIFGMLFPVVAVAGPFQDLNRINNIVSQARGLADTVRASHGMPTPSYQTFPNPFSVTQGTVAFASQPLPTVAINPGEIRVTTGGIDMSVPRIQPGVSVGVPGAVTTGIPATVARADNTVQAYRDFAAAVKAFRGADYNSAKQHMQGAVTAMPNQAAFSQFHSLVHFATGDYKRAAEFAYSSTAVSPLPSWHQLRGYYGNPQHYTDQYQRLQSAVNTQSDPSTNFLLGYHHLMLGHHKHAQSQLQAVITALPNDPVAGRLIGISQQIPPAPQQ